MTDWKRTIVGIPELLDGFADGQLDLPTLTEKLIELLKKDRAYPRDREFVSVVEDLETFQGEHDQPYFDLILNALYDWADRVQVWIEPVPTRR